MERLETASLNQGEQDRTDPRNPRDPRDCHSRPCPPLWVTCVPRAHPIEFFPADSLCDSFSAPGMPGSTQKPQAPVLSLVTAKCPREIPGRARGLVAHSTGLPWAEEEPSVLPVNSLESQSPHLRALTRGHRAQGQKHLLMSEELSVERWEPGELSNDI